MKQRKGSRKGSHDTSPATKRRWLLYAVAIILVLSAATAVLVRSISERSDSHRSPDHQTHTASSSATNREATAAVGIKNIVAPASAPAGMAWIPGGTFWMGCDTCEMDDAKPVHLVEVDEFWMDRTPVTNASFTEFVKATGYVTVAERKPDPRDYPGVDPDRLVAGSAVFYQPSEDVPLDDISRWWKYVPGASWKHPEGPGTTIDGLEQHPVVHIAWEDAVAYAGWAGKRLPTEAEFEFAARGGLDRSPYAWGDELKPDGKWAANIWQGRFPLKNLVEDGYVRTSPVTAFPPNGFGLYDVGGNVWQWCSDWYRPDYFETLASVVARNPQGPPDSLDPSEPGIKKRVQKGGSFLCSDRYCSRYLAGSRGRGAADSGGSNVGFRCVKSP